ncbi:Mobile element protein [Pediococcus damnosus]|uniref:Mobile element protein n=1 Tax=Pediococcus damnosus TaxID=51663 RepID=A0AAC9FJT5_9LACO|nr:Mobile element protein [Pediococcus damnosus]AMV63552.1 Mobile element protein [Pediococcus damnosus]AMV65341.1 Mobile element protein [Pediococcus damnosus]AMV66508.1 Mobile element protein [Pediococcus damnosus]AMV68813.1 Mobile element protein [Pediococcus damnosus]
MRKSQKTEQIADHRWMAGLEGQAHIGARSTASGENTSMSGIKFQDLILARNNLNLAYQRVTKNKGAAGLDGMTVKDLLPYLKEHRKELLEQLVNGTYKPAPVKRVEIPKPNGGTRKLGIPTVVDRMVQQAVAQVMSPVFEQVFSNSSFGFRPGRSAQQAIKQVTSFYNGGYITKWLT